MRLCRLEISDPGDPFAAVSGQQRFRDREAKRLGGLEVDDEFEFRRLLNRQIGFFALEDAADVAGREPVRLGLIGAKRD